MCSRRYRVEVQADSENGHPQISLHQQVNSAGTIDLIDWLQDDPVDALFGEVLAATLDELGIPCAPVRAEVDLVAWHHPGDGWETDAEHEYEVTLVSCEKSSDVPWASRWQDLPQHVLEETRNSIDVYDDALEEGP